MATDIHPNDEVRMRILFINSDGGGYAGNLEVADGTSVGQLFAAQVPHGKPADFLIRVNRLPVHESQVLQENDRISITPRKIEGA
jgi:hypothetical protein